MAAGEIARTDQSFASLWGHDLGALAIAKREQRLYSLERLIRQRQGKTMRTIVLALWTLLVFSIASAEAESYSGQWEAADQMEHKCARFVAHITVAGSNITIKVVSVATYTLKGTVAPDGSFTAGEANGSRTANGKFAGDAVELTLLAGCGSRTTTGHRAD
jgi:hypothetical protein